MSLPQATVGRADRAPVLVFGDDSSAFLGAVRSLGRQGLEVHGAGSNMSLPAYASLYLADHHVIPPYRGDGAEWLATVRSLIRQHGFALLVPTSDASLVQLSSHAEDLLPARCAVPSAESLGLFTDKWNTRKAAQALDIPVADGMLINDDCDVDAVTKALGLPLILKQRRSYSRGQSVQKSAVAIVSSPEELARRMDGSPSMIAEAFIPGFCRGVSVLAYQGEILQAFQHCRLRQEHATGPSSWRVSEPLDPRMLEAARKLIAHADYTGIAMFEFRCHKQHGDFALLEVNARIWGSIHLAMGAGADYVAALHDLLLEGRMPVSRRDFAVGGQKMSLRGEWDGLAYAWEETIGLKARLALLPRLASLLSSLTSGAGFDSFVSDDPEPFLRERRMVLLRLRDKIWKSVPLSRSEARA